MELVMINEIKYHFIKDFKHDDLLRQSFNTLAKRTFSIDFEQWYNDGYWLEQYVPYALADQGKVISNVSVNIQDFLVFDKPKRYIQIGTVMTDPNYQNRGLSRYLMERVVCECQGHCELIYLFANDSVLDFYPKFSFTPVQEYQHKKTITSTSSSRNVTKLDMSLDSSRQLLLDKIASSQIFSSVCMQNNPGLIMFYCTSFLKDCVYYIPAYDAIAIAIYDNDTLHLKDVFCAQDVRLDDIINEMVDAKINKVVFGFTPKDTNRCSVQLLKEEDTTLFMLKPRGEWLNNELMLPVLSHA